MSFRLLTEYHSFLLSYNNPLEILKAKFPSPYGVSFILISILIVLYIFLIKKFPSPYGVSFILM